MTRIGVLLSRYPTLAHPYANMFAHTRNRHYVQQGVEVDAWVPSRHENMYALHGVTVRTAPVQKIADQLERYDGVCIHLLYHRIRSIVDGGLLYDAILKLGVPTLFFLHGVEVQRIWHTRRMDIRFSSPRSLLRAFYFDAFHLRRMRTTLSRFMSDVVPVRFITPSIWLRETAEDSTGVRIRNKSLTIPNGIDTRRFQFRDHWKNRRRLLSIRRLELGGTSAVDLALSAMTYLDKTFQLSLIGEGPHLARIDALLARENLESRIDLRTTFLTNEKIPSIHSQHGIYLATTRVDSQGVSMCEAMSSGLPVISFRVCAIPEFVKHEKTGMLAEPEDAQTFADHVRRISSDRRLFRTLAEASRAAMEDIDIRATTALELETLRNLKA